MYRFSGRLGGEGISTASPGGSGGARVGLGAGKLKREFDGTGPAGTLSPGVGDPSSMQLQAAGVLIQAALFLCDVIRAMSHR